MNTQTAVIVQTAVDRKTVPATALDIILDINSLIGKQVTIRQVTFHHIGILIGVTHEFYVLIEASTIMNAPDYKKFLRGNLSSSEVVEYPGMGIVYLARGACVDIAEITA